MSIIAQCCNHEKNCIREKPHDRIDFAEVLMIDPLVIAMTHLLNMAIGNQLLPDYVENMLCIQLFGAYHSIVAVKCFLIVIYILRTTHPSRIFTIRVIQADDSLQLHFTVLFARCQYSFYQLLT